MTDFGWRSQPLSRPNSFWGIKRAAVTASAISFASSRISASALSLTADHAVATEASVAASMRSLSCVPESVSSARSLSSVSRPRADSAAASSPATSVPNWVARPAR